MGFELFGITIQFVVIWMAVAIIFTIIEGLTLGLTAIWFAAGALLAMLVGFLGLNIWVQMIAFLIGSAVLLVYTRPLAIKVFKIGHVKTNVESLIGIEGIVIKELQPFSLGQVRLKGQIWSAKPFDENPILEGVKVEVVKIEGVKLIVKAIEG